MNNIIQTALKNVFILDPEFTIPQLSRTRRIWIYLPENYFNSKKKFPVLYMHDGQNLFDDETSYSGEWGVDDTLNSISGQCIVVGIDNGGMLRMTEYNPNDTEQFGKGEGGKYLEFIVKTLKPYIDKNFRALRSKKHTMMAGSSMGGLISFYGGILHPHTFGRIGIFSPSFWIAPQLRDQLKQRVKPRRNGDQKYYFYAGGAEYAGLVNVIKEVADLLRFDSGATVSVKINPDGWHSEICWRNEFPRFFQWISS